MMRYEALFIAELFGNIGGSIRFIQKEMDNIPSCFIAEGFEEKLVRFI
jgi:hypothetical protein